LAVILQGVYAVAPTHLRWSQAHRAMLPDYLFSPSHTPFGPFTASLELSRPVLDACMRNPVVAHLMETTSDASLRGVQIPAD
jgi:hypothetical protein